MRYGTPMVAGRRKWQLLAAIGLSVFVLDQASKILAVEHLTPGIANAQLGAERRVATFPEIRETLKDLSFFDKAALYYGEVRHPCARRGRLCPEMKSIEGFWSWRYAENTGAAWSILAGRRYVLLVVSLIAIGFVIQFLRKLEPDQGMLVVALSLILGGAFGNMFDRLYLGYVVDFILWYHEDLYWPTFNVADTAISTGVGLIVLNMILEFVAAKKNADTPQGSVAPQ